jgi:PAS domain S-box-containing protein
MYDNNINTHIKNYENNNIRVIFTNPLFRIKITHIIAVLVLLISAIFFTEAMLPFYIQIIIAVIIIFHDLDDKNLKQLLSNKIKLLNSKEEELSEIVKKRDDALQLISSHIIYSKFDLDGKVTDCSDAFCRISQFSREEIVGYRCKFLELINNKYNHIDLLWDKIQGQNTSKQETQNTKKDGSKYWLETIVDIDYDNKKNKIGYIAISYDITSKKDLEEKQIQLIQSEKLKSTGEIINNIAHQWRQPLNSISVLASSINLNYELNQEMPQKTIINSMNKIISITQTLSDTIDLFGRLISSTEYKTYNLQNTITNCLKVLDASLLSHNIVMNNIINNTSNINISMIEGELSQVFINIINNSIDAIIENKIKKPLITIESTKIDKKIQIIITDNAGGIHEDILASIFEPYFTTKHSSQGTGLGLYISHKIITENFHGILKVQNINSGTKISITFPISIENK